MIRPLPKWGSPVAQPVTYADALANLQHTLALFADDDGSRRVITATQNVYGPQVWTGLSIEDLRLIAAEIGVSK